MASTMGEQVEGSAVLEIPDFGVPALDVTLVPLPCLLVCCARSAMRIANQVETGNAKPPLFQDLHSRFSVVDTEMKLPFQRIRQFIGG